MPRFIAVDLGSHAVKVTVLRTSGRKVEVEDRDRAPVVQDGTTLPDLDARLAALDDVLARHRDWKGAGTVGLAWSSGEATMHPLTLPFTDRAQVDKTLPFAVEEVVPFDLDDMVLSWRVCEVTDETRALVALAPEEPLRAALDGLKARGLEPRAVNVTGEVLGAYAGSDGVEAVVDVGHGHTTICVVDHGRVRLARAVSVGGRDLTLAVQRVTHTTFPQAEALREGRRHGDVPGPAADDEVTDPGAGLSSAAVQAMRQPLATLLAEVRATLITAEDTLGLEIERLRLTGGAAVSTDLSHALSQGLGLRAEAATDPVSGDAVPGPWAVSQGLALHLAGRWSADLIDLRAGVLSFRGGIDVFRLVTRYGVALFAVFLVASVVFYVVQARSLSAQLVSVNADITAVVTETYPDVNPTVVADSGVAKSIMRERTDDVVARAAVLAAEGGKPPTIDLLYELSSSFPPAEEVTVDVSEMTIATGAINLDAETTGYGEVATIEESVKRNARFSNAETRDPKKVRDKIQFVLSIPLGDDVPADAGGEG